MSSTAHAEWQEGPNGLSFFTKRWLPSGVPTVAKLIFIHGFMEHILRYDHVYSRYAEKGIEVFAFDQRGFGQTAAQTDTRGHTSWPEGLSDIEFIVKQEASEPTVKVFLMGHSMGGGLAYAYFTRRIPLPSVALITGGLILSSPLIQQAPAVASPRLFIILGSIVGGILPKLTLTAKVSPQDICRDPEVQEAYSKDPLCPPIGTFKGVSDMILGGQALLDRDHLNFPSNVSILAVHGTGDKVTNYEATRNLIASTDVDDKEFKAFDGFYHEMHNEPGNFKIEEMDYIIAWIKKRV